MSETPPVAFLGFVERAAQVRDEGYTSWKYNLLGMTNVLFSCLYPMSITGLSVALAVHDVPAMPPIQLSVVDDEDAEITSVTLELGITTVSQEETSQQAVSKQESAMVLPQHSWTFFVLPADQLGIVIDRPGTYKLSLKRENGSVAIGEFRCILIEPPPLTPDRMAALRSDPRAYKMVQAHMRCNRCSDMLIVYAAFERDPQRETAGEIWHADLKDTFVCKCGQTVVNMSLYKRNLPVLLTLTGPVYDALGITPMYEQEGLQAIRDDFARLLNIKTAEETYQKYIEQNPILLHQFSPQRIFFKAPILTRYNCDFAIINNQRELILIELEKPHTILLKRNGHEHSELSHAFGQVGDWLRIAEDHRAAFLECIGVHKEEVGAVRGVVIAGRDSSYPSEHMRRLKGHYRGRVQFLTYDDLLASIVVLCRNFEML